jgi:hypothetical protein
MFFSKLILMFIIVVLSRFKSVHIQWRALLEQRKATGRMTGVRFPTGAGDFSLLHTVQTGSGAHPASYPALLQRVKQPGGEADRSHPSTSKVKNDGAITPHLIYR